MSRQHERCGERLDCPCWIVGAQEEAEMHRARLSTRRLTDYIRALGDTDPAMSERAVAEAVYRVFGPGDERGYQPGDGARVAAVPWADNGLAALDELDRLYYDGVGPTVAEYRAATDAIRTALAAAADRMEGALG